ncbi:MAG: hypothetical protein GY925_09630, partial [Actinomycetia bacterium]|nr:hypothetical protein [Actinomycetes bacterium]
MAITNIDLLTAAEAETVLNDDDIDTDDADVLESYIHSVSRALDWWYGPIIARTHTDTFDGGCGRVWLTQRPITSV